MDCPVVRTDAAGGARRCAEGAPLAVTVGAIAIKAWFALGGHFPLEILLENRDILAVKGARAVLVQARFPLARNRGARIICFAYRCIRPAACRAAYLDGAA